MLESDSELMYQCNREKIHPSAIYGKEITGVDRAGFRFFLRLGGVAFILIAIGASWGVASAISGMFGWLFTWIFWVCFAAAFCIYIPCVVWSAYQSGVFEE